MSSDVQEPQWRIVTPGFGGQQAPEVAPVEQETPEAPPATPEEPVAVTLAEIPVTETQPPAPSAQEPPKSEVEPPAPVNPYQELENDELFKKIVDSYKSGDFQNFIGVMGRDYDKMSDEDILKLDIDRSNPSLSKEDRDFLFRKELEKQYGVGSEEDEDKRLGQIKLMRDAAKIREGLKQEQHQYKAPVIEPSKDTDPRIAQYEQQAAVQAAQMDDFKKMVESNPILKQFETNRIIQFGEGEAQFNYEVDPSVDIKAQTLDMNLFFSKFWNEDGTMNMSKWIKFSAIANDLEGFERAYAAHNRKLGEKGFYDSLRNTSVETSGEVPSKTQGFVLKSINGRAV